MKQFKFTHTLITAVFILNFHSFSKAQSPGYIHLKVFGSKHPGCKIDSLSFSSNDTILPLLAGQHRVRAWIPKASLIDTTVLIKESDTVKCSVSLQYSQEYLSYTKAYNNYRFVRKRRYFVSPIYMGFTIGTGVLVGKVLAEKQFKLAMDSKDEYDRTGSQAMMNQKKVDFANYKRKYDNYKKLEYGIYGFSGILFVNYIRILIKQAHTPIPQFKEKNLLAKINIQIYPTIVNKNIQGNLLIHF